MFERQKFGDDAPHQFRQRVAGDHGEGTAPTMIFEFMELCLYAKVFILSPKMYCLSSNAERHNLFISTVFMT